MNDTHYIHPRVLKLNVGYLLSEGPGFSRENELEIPSTLRVAEDLTVGYLLGTLRLSRTSRGILVQATFQTRLTAECVRCLEETDLELEVPVEEIYVYPPEPDASFVVDESGILDLAPLIREETLLATPKHVLCQPRCLGLCMTCGENRNRGGCTCDDVKIDPRLSALKALRDSMVHREAVTETVEPYSSKRRKGA